jgi:single-strand DNA-binding protein
MLNRVILIGRLATDPEPKHTPSGIAVTTFRIAVDRPMSQEARQQGQEKQADFIDIVAWRQSAEFAANYLSKGRLVAIEGRLQIREWVAQDGQRRRNAEVVADNLKGLDRPREGQENGDGGGGDYAGAGAAPEAGGGYNRASGGGGGGYDRAAPAGGSGGGRGNFRRRPRWSGGARGGGNASFNDDDDISDIGDPFAE